MSIPIQVRGIIESTAGISFEGKFYDGKSKKSSDRTISFTLSSAPSDTTLTGHVPPKYLTPPLVPPAPPAAHVSESKTRPASYTVEDKLFQNSTPFRNFVDQVAAVLQQSLNISIGSDMHIRQEQIALVVIAKLFPRADQRIENQMFKAFIDYISQFQEYGICDKNQLNHLTQIAAAAFPTDSIAARNQ